MLGCGKFLSVVSGAGVTVRIAGARSGRCPCMEFGSEHLDFLRATAYMLLRELRICYRNSVRLSVYPSVTWVDQSKTVEVRIVQFSPYISPIPLVFAR